MIKSPTIPTLRSIFCAGAGPAVAAMATPLLTPASAQAEDARHAGAEPLNGNGFYRFKIGDFQATVISDGYAELPVSPIFVMNATEAELAPVLKANFMQPAIQVTNNPLVVDTGRERILVDTGFGEKIGPPFGSFPRLEANLDRAGMTPESIDLVVISHGHLDHIGGLVTKSGALAFPTAQFVFVDTEWNYWTGGRYESEVNTSPMPDPFKNGTIGAARENLPPVADRSRFVKQGGEITSGVHYIAAPGHSPSHASILFASGKEQFMHMGDIAHNPVTSLQHPDWTPVFDYEPAQGDQVAQGHSGPRRDRSGHGDGLSFSVPSHWTCRPTRHGIPLGNRPVGLVIERVTSLRRNVMSSKQDASKSPSWTTTSTSLFRSRTGRCWMRGRPSPYLATISRTPKPSSSACSHSTSSA